MKSLRPLVLTIVGLALLDIWCDTLGHGTAFVEAARTVSESASNPRIFWNLSLVVFAGLIVLFPRWFDGRCRIFNIAMPAFAALATFAYGVPSWNGSAVPVVLVGLMAMCYGWLEVRLLFEAARFEKVFYIMIALVVSRVIKATAVAVMGLFDGVVQVALTSVAVLACGAFLVLAVRNRAVDNTLSDSEAWRLSSAERAVFVAFVVLFPLFNAVSRAFSPLGFWGDASIVGLEGLLSALPACIGYALCVGVVFRRCDSGSMFTRMAVGLLVMLGLLFLTDEIMLKELGVAPVAIQTASVSVELYSNFLIWFASIMAARMLEWHPMRSLAMTEFVMSIFAVIMSLVLQYASHFGRYLLTLVLYIVVAVLVVVVWRARESAFSEATDGPSNGLAEACGRIAAERHLSPRETEVFELLAEGRSRPYIAERLVISDATVKSHTNSIYKKLGVHSKQEIIDLVHG